MAARKKWNSSRCDECANLLTLQKPSKHKNIRYNDEGEDQQRTFSLECKHNVMYQRCVESSAWIVPISCFDWIFSAVQMVCTVLYFHKRLLAQRGGGGGRGLDNSITVGLLYLFMQRCDKWQHICISFIIEMHDVITLWPKGT